jgi:NADH-quinone oxidoreductase subunit H
MVLSAMVPVVLAGSLSLADIVEYQHANGWFIVWPLGPGIFAFLIFFMTALAEGNRIPFDIPEAESELVAGPTTEYNAINWSIFAAGEYGHSLIVSALTSTLFLGGWSGPYLPPLAWMLIKTGLMFTLITWIRWSLTRLRSDQLMSLCWKYLVPFSLMLLLVAGIWTHLGG